LELARKIRAFTGDDVNRIERPGGTRDWSRLRSTITAGTRRVRNTLEEIDINGWPIPKQVDYRLIGSVLSRVHWELTLIRAGNAILIFIEQTLTRWPKL